MTLIFLFLCLLGGGRAYQSRFDVVEINTVYTQCGEPSLEQVLFWRWCPQYKRLHCEAWRHVGDCEFRGNLVLVRDKLVKASVIIETHTRHDPEVKNRSVYPVRSRTGL